MKAKESFRPLYYEGDEFKIVRLNKEPELMPIEARRLKTGQVFGFQEGELA